MGLRRQAPAARHEVLRVERGVKVHGINGYQREAKTEGEPEAEDGLGPEERKNYQVVAARVNYIAGDTPCVKFSAKEICKHMADPKVADLQMIKKLARFMVGLKEARSVMDGSRGPRPMR